MSVDNAKPFYNVCGGAQDNWSHCGPSRSLNRWGVRTSDWFIVGGGDGFQTRNDPNDPTIVYASSQDGNVSRLDLKTGLSRSIRPPMSRQMRGAGGDDSLGGAPAGAAPSAQGAAGAAGAQAPGAQGGQGQRGGAGGGAAAGSDRANWDAPYIISPHSPTRVYWASNKLYRSDDRGDTWAAISGDLSRNLKREEIPIMGKVWPPDSVALNVSTTALSNIVSVDESPLLEGLIWVGTDDGLVQVTEDGGKNWRKIEQFPNVPQWTYVSDVFASPRDANTVFVTLNNWQRGDYKPYIVKSADRGKTWSNITGNLPDRHDAWSIIQDHVNGELLFAGTEFGLFFTVDGGRNWVQLKGGMPPAQVRDMTVQRGENDLVLATFGRGFYVLDDYSPLREITPQALAEEARLFPLRDTYSFSQTGMSPAGSASIGAMAGNWTAPNPPFGAVFTYQLKQALPADTKLVLTITDGAGKQVRQIELGTTTGVRRIAWNLRGDAPAVATPAVAAPTVAAPAVAAPAGAPQGQRGTSGGGGRGGRLRPWWRAARSCRAVHCDAGQARWRQGDRHRPVPGVPRCAGQSVGGFRPDRIEKLPLGATGLDVERPAPGVTRQLVFGRPDHRVAPGGYRCLEPLAGLGLIRPVEVQAREHREHPQRQRVLGRPALRHDRIDVLDLPRRAAVEAHLVAHERSPGFAHPDVGAFLLERSLASEADRGQLVANVVGPQPSKPTRLERWRGRLASRWRAGWLLRRRTAARGRRDDDTDHGTRQPRTTHMRPPFARSLRRRGKQIA